MGQHIKLCRWFVIVTLLFSGVSLAYLPQHSSAKDITESEPDTPEEKIDITEPKPDTPDGKWVDKAHEEISKRIIQTSKRIDGFFGDERVEEEEADSQIKITTSVTISEGENLELTFPLSVKLALPHLKNRWHLMIDTLLKEDDDEELEDQNEDEDETNDVTVSVRYKIREQTRRWISMSNGIKIHSDNIIEPFSKLRGRRIFDFDPWALRLTQYVFWFEDDGFGESSRFDIERRIQQKMLFRMTSKATWTEYSHGLEFSQIISLRKQLSNNRAIGLTLSGEGYTSPSTVMDKYAAKLTFRRRLYKNWLFLEVDPGVQFLREDDFELSPLITFNFELRLGNVSSR